MSNYRSSSERLHSNEKDISSLYTPIFQHTEEYPQAGNEKDFYWIDVKNRLRMHLQDVEFHRKKRSVTANALQQEREEVPFGSPLKKESSYAGGATTRSPAKALGPSPSLPTLPTTDRAHHRTPLRSLQRAHSPSKPGSQSPAPAPLLGATRSLGNLGDGGWRLPPNIGSTPGSYDLHQRSKASAHAWASGSPPSQVESSTGSAQGPATRRPPPTAHSSTSRQQPDQMDEMNRMLYLRLRKRSSVGKSGQSFDNAASRALGATGPRQLGIGHALTRHMAIDNLNTIDYKPKDPEGSRLSTTRRR